MSVSHTPRPKTDMQTAPPLFKDHHQSRHSISSISGDVTAGTDVQHNLKRLDPSSGVREPPVSMLQPLPLPIVAFATLSCAPSPGAVVAIVDDSPSVPGYGASVGLHSQFVTAALERSFWRGRRPMKTCPRSSDLIDGSPPPFDMFSHTKDLLKSPSPRLLAFSKSF